MKMIRNWKTCNNIMENISVFILFTLIAGFTEGCYKVPIETNVSDSTRKQLISARNKQKAERKVGSQNPDPGTVGLKQRTAGVARKINIKPLVVISYKNPDPRRMIHRRTIGKSGRNRPIKSVVIGHGKDTVLFIGTVHGNERAGTPLIWRLAGYLGCHPRLVRGRKIVLLPMVNPDGAELDSRYNAHGVDLNRNFATANRINKRRHGFKALSEPETRAIVQAIKQCSPDRIVVFHQPLTCIDYDGPAKKLAIHMAKYCNLPVRKLGAMPGSLGSYAGLALNIPTITFELPKGAENLNLEALWKLYGQALIASVVYPQEPDAILRAGLNKGK
ncbi:MAG: murein peptide amidase A [Desulfobacteraceae bacterium]|nr:murein peptide amidase A [Desulfobacteraceae bacterium]